ncbi:MAG: diacylglycerol kinase family protein [Pseudomonadales bacterium]
MNKPLDVKKRIDSFIYAGRGIKTLIATQPNAWIHLLATGLVLLLAYFLQVQRWEWVALILAIGLVWLGEAMNTAVEFVADAVSQDYNENIKHAKDVGAGGVLLAAIIAAVIAAIVFLPHLI